MSDKVNDNEINEIVNAIISDFDGGKNIDELEKLFDMKKILRLKRKPNILMGVFSMSIGGGETFPWTSR